MVFLTNGLTGKNVAAEEIANDIWKIYYRDVFWEYFNENELRNKEKSIGTIKGHSLHFFMLQLEWVLQISNKLLLVD